MDYSKQEVLRMLSEIEARERACNFSTPSDIFTRLKEFRNEEVEYFFVIGLNGKHIELYLDRVSKGTLDRTIVHPREVFKRAISEGCSAIVVGHNHPSGSPEPSIEDMDLTKRLVDAGQLLGIPVLDHVIVAEMGYYSFMEKGTL